MKCEKAEIWNREVEFMYLSDLEPLLEIQIHIYNMEVTASHKAIRRLKYDNLLSII